ncbi:MAG: argininosuccinate lyase [Candidatus Cyclobacteriaceae bacterium M3_2C_046]
MKLWQKDIDIDQRVEAFTIGKDGQLDLQIAEFDVLGSLAHAIMLESIGLLTTDEQRQLNQELKKIYHTIKNGNFEIEPGVEDVHSQVEMLLTQSLGDTGKKIHSGRSRNDQVLLDLRLFTRQAIKNIVEAVKSLFETLQNQSENYKSILMPGYTHFQVAMPSSFGLWFGAYAESLVEDLYTLEAAFKMANQNPLGSAAGYGASFPLDRSLTTSLLGFDTLSYNVVNAQMGRGKTEKTMAFAMSGLAATLSKLSADICLYNSQNFGFISFPDHFTTGSSIMPHKKNPDVFELIRAKCNKIQALPFEINLILGNLPSGYHRDLQVIKESYLAGIQELISCLEMMDMALSLIRVNDRILEDDRYRLMFSVEAVNREVLQGRPFREAYQKVAKDIREGVYQDVKKVAHTHEGSIGNLCNAEILQKMNKLAASFNFEPIDQALQKLIS